MQLEPHGSASAGTSSFAIQAHCFVRAIEHLRKVQLHVLPERVQRLGGLDGRTLSRIWICIKHAQKNCNHLILNSSIIACFSCYSCLLFLFLSCFSFLVILACFSFLLILACFSFLVRSG